MPGFTAAVLTLEDFAVFVTKDFAVLTAEDFAVFVTEDFAVFVAEDFAVFVAEDFVLAAADLFMAAVGFFVTAAEAVLDFELARGLLARGFLSSANLFCSLKYYRDTRPGCQNDPNATVI